MSNNHNIHVFGEVLFDHFPDGSRVLGGNHVELLPDYDAAIGRLIDEAPGD